MKPSDQDKLRRNGGAQDGKTAAAWLPVVAAVAIMVTGCLSTFLVLELDEFRPKVGDIVSFKPGSQDTDMWQMNISATLLAGSKAPAGDCMLDPNIMAERGGSLIVEGRETEPVLRYHIHWAGAATARSANCGETADLVVSRTDLQRLANAAGGFGVGDKGIKR
jgi:hypothetical protein